MHNSSKCFLNVLLSQLVWFQIKICYTNIRLFFPIQNIFVDFQKSSLHLLRAVRENAMSCLKLSSAGTTNTTKILIDYKEHRNQFVTENNLHLLEHVAPFPCICEELWSNPLENIQRFVQPVWKKNGQKGQIPIKFCKKKSKERVLRVTGNTQTRKS